MSKLFLGSSCKALVALALDDSDVSTLDVARLLGNRADQSLRLLHAVPSFARRLPSALVEDDGPLNDLSEAVDESREMLAAGELRRIAAELHGDGPSKNAPGHVIETAVAIGTPADAILADAVAHRVRLIVVGRSTRSYDRVPASWSTVLRLATESPIPLIVAGRSIRSRADRRLRMLIADDLAWGGEVCALTGLDLARALGDVDVLHAHVNPVTLHAVQEALRDLGRTDPDSAAGFVASELADRAQRRLSGTLDDRVRARAALLAARGCTYRSVIAGGDPLLELEREASAFEADILVFGRHREPGRSPGLLGKISHAAMLREDRIVVVVPPRP